MTRLRKLNAVGALACALFAGACWAAEPSPGGPAWSSLTAAQRQTLAPLQQDWSSIEPNRKQKWVEMAAKFPSLPAEERQRIQARMADWARLTPTERARARLQFQEAQQLPSEERQERWKAYQALSPEERKTLAQRARPVARAGSGAGAASGAASGAGTVVSEGGLRLRASADAASVATNSKRNLVVPTSPVPSRVVSPATTPMVVQARPGATTSNMSTKAVPPSHNQAGLPKIAATPGYVDRNTLLPRRGPQGAAVRAAASADPAEQP